jgi:hypothetical protein
LKEIQLKQLHINEMNELTKYMEEQGYTVINRTTSEIKANLSVLFILPIVISLSFLYTKLWGWTMFTKAEIIILAFTLIILILAHEFIHAIVCAFYCVNKWKSIRFGILGYILPYCHCSELLNITHYRLVAIAPLIILGIIPYLLSLLIGNLIIVSCSLYIIIGASGDLLIIRLLRKGKKEVLVHDHPTAVGSLVFIKD